MNSKKYNLLNMYIEKIKWYSMYVDCLGRILNDYIQNGDYNIKPCDVPNLSVLLSKYMDLLYSNINSLAREWEFLDSD